MVSIGINQPPAYVKIQGPPKALRSPLKTWWNQVPEGSIWFNDFWPASLESENCSKLCLFSLDIWIKNFDYFPTLSLIFGQSQKKLARRINFNFKQILAKFLLFFNIFFFHPTLSLFPFLRSLSTSTYNYSPPIYIVFSNIFKPSIFLIFTCFPQQLHSKFEPHFGHFDSNSRFYSKTSTWKKDSLGKNYNEESYQRMIVRK